VGLDLNNHPNPLVTASFGLPFYMGFLGIGLIATSLIVGDIAEKRKTHERRGVGAIFHNWFRMMDRQKTSRFLVQ
jgi:hypothetical protein